MFRISQVIALLGVLLCVCGSSLAQDILGCGGFVKSEVEINFSLVEIKLYTKQGSLKYRTDCAPNNGYYMVPVYDKGEYVLKVEPPVGWTFEPETVDLLIDGTNDRCSRGEDINFQFTGFGVVGKVVSKGQTDGPAGVTLTLSKLGSTEVIKETTSEVGGSYGFERVLPGEYSVTAKHPSWTFDQANTKVIVGRETGNAGNSITIRGYDVTGRVFSDGEPIRGVNFVLYSNTVRPNDVTNCNRDKVPGMPAGDTKGLLCYVVSGQDGVFTFPSLPYGEYRLVPFYKGDHITFDVVPAELHVAVKHESVVFKDAFQVAGFSVQGIVRNVANGAGVPGAHVFLDGKEQAVTKADGTYHLDSMHAGTYTLLVTAERLFFDPLTVKVNPNTPRLPDVIAARFSLCGRVIIDKIPEGLGQVSQHRQVTVTDKAQGAVVTLFTDTQGGFCKEFTPGLYVVEAVISEAEQRAGLKLAPPNVEVHITDAPSMNTIFSQFRARVSGQLTCLEDCGPQQLSIAPQGSRGEDKVFDQAITDGKTATFEFTDVMPGKYKVTLMNEGWCWKEKSVDVEIVDSDVADVAFSQVGYILLSSLSHDITLNFEQENKPGNVGSFNLTKGISKFCLAEPGVYRLTPDSCHLFEQETYTYDTSAPHMLTMTAVKHRMEGTVVTEKRQQDIIVTIKSSIEGEPLVTLGPLVSDKEPVPSKDPKVKVAEPTGPFTYKFTYMARNGERLDIRVSSAQLLFHPPSAEVSIRGDVCPGVVATFEGRQGVFISGQINPALVGVHITITDVKNADVKINMDTDEQGTFRVGPLHGDTEYGVTAEKEGYVFTEVAGKLGHFNAFKLGEINVKVVDKEGVALQSVLLSLSGSSQYRSNKLTLADGTMVFLGLSPGQYFLRPMMKEYRFEPSSQMLNVEEGSTINFSISGTRIAFSAYGAVTSLNGEPEADVIVEALSGGPGDCHHHQEESKTEGDGSFRIRGLQPNCEYEVRLKSGDVNQHIERSSAQVQSVKVQGEDLRNLNIIAFRRLNQLDLSGNVVTSQEHLATLKVHLYREANPDSPLHTVPLSQTPFFYLPSLTIDGQTYLIRLDSTLSRFAYEYTLPEASFVANSSHEHFTFTFDPKVEADFDLFFRASMVNMKPRPIDQELNHSSFLVLPFTLLLLVLGYHHQRVLPILSQMLSYIQSVLSSSASSSGGNTQSTASANTTYQYNPELFADSSASNKKKQKIRKA